MSYQLHIDEYQQSGYVDLEVIAPEPVLNNLSEQYGGERTPKGINLSFNFGSKRPFKEIQVELHDWVKAAFAATGTPYTPIRELKTPIEHIKMVIVNSEYPVEYPHADTMMFAYVYDMDLQPEILDVFEWFQWDELEVNLDVFRQQGFQTTLLYVETEGHRHIPAILLTRPA